MLEIKVGDRVYCITSGVVGYVTKMYVPTACEKQIMVRTNDGRLYHAPYSQWLKF